MAKINFTKVEKSFDRAVQKLMVDQLVELASIANAIQDTEKIASNQALEQIIKHFQKELKKIKNQDALLYEKLNLTSSEEQKLYVPAHEYTKDDWILLKSLKVRIDDLKKEFYGQDKLNKDFDKQVNKERRRHINKRHNIREGWLPLH